MSGYLAKPFKAHDLFAAVEGRGAQPGDTEAASPPAVDLAGFRRTMEEAGAAEAVDGILETFVATCRNGWRHPLPRPAAPRPSRWSGRRMPSCPQPGRSAR